MFDRVRGRLPAYQPVLEQRDWSDCGIAFFHVLKQIISYWLFRCGVNLRHVAGALFEWRTYTSIS